VAHREAEGQREPIDTPVLQYRATARGQAGQRPGPGHLGGADGSRPSAERATASGESLPAASSGPPPGGQCAAEGAAGDHDTRLAELTPLVAPVW
jgi:hypothetical protein